MNRILFGFFACCIGAVAVYSGVRVIVTGQVRHPILNPYPLWNPSPSGARVSGVLQVVIGLALIWRGLGLWPRSALARPHTAYSRKNDC